MILQFHHEEDTSLCADFNQVPLSSQLETNCVVRCWKGGERRSVRATVPHGGPWLGTLVIMTLIVKRTQHRC
jgi:hypothetical protein